MKWERKTIDDVCSVGDGAHASIKRVSDGFQYLTSKNFKLSGLDLTKVDYISEEDYQKHFKDESKAITKPKSNDILLSIIGSLGAPYLVNENDVFGLSSSVSILRPNIGKIEPKYLYYWIKSYEFQSSINNIKSGVAQSFLSLGMIKSLPVIFPIELSSQRKIAYILSAYDDLIENNLKRIKLLEEKAKLHYKELMQEIIFSKNKKEEYIKDCLAYYIGGGWGEEDYKEGFTEPAFVIRGTDFPDALKGEIKNVPFRYHKESNLASRNLLAGDIVFEVSGGSKGQPVGRSLLITGKLLQQFNRPAMCASFCKMLRPNETVTPEFFYLYLLASQENGVIAQYEKHSASNIVNYGFEEFICEQKISIPKITELIVFTERVKPIFTLISTLGGQNTKLREARDILLTRLISGQICV